MPALKGTLAGLAEAAVAGVVALALGDGSTLSGTAMKNAFRAAVLLVAVSVPLALAESCGGNSCVVGASSACACPDGRTGAQVCQADHTLGTCLCVGGSGGAGGGTGGTGGSGGAGGAGGVKRVFVTETTYTGSTMGGVAGADQKCNLSAQAAQLGGTWVAWVSSSSVNAIDRVTAAGPWVLINTSTTIFNNKANLATSPLLPINATEQGHTITTASTVTHVWTGTDNGGNAAASTCNGWSSSTLAYGTIGFAYSTSGWTSYTDQDCGATNHLYCFEQ